MNMDVYLAQQRAKAKIVRARADARLRELGGGSVSRRSVPKLEDMTAEELERDAASIRKIIGIWRQIGKRTPSTIKLPSGRVIVPKSSANGQHGGQRENALGRPRHRRPGRS
jgi:hypothetical protein